MTTAALPRDREAVLVAAAQAGNDRACADLLDAYEALIGSVVRGVVTIPPSLDRADLVQEGRLGLLDALRDFDPAHGTRFATYARPRVLRFVWAAVAEALGTSETTLRRFQAAVDATETLEEAREFATSPERGTDRMTAETFDEVAHARAVLYQSVEEAALYTAPDPFAGIEAEETVAALMETLESRERLALAVAFGLDGEEPSTDAALAARLGIDKSTATRLRNRALAQVRETARI